MKAIKKGAKAQNGGKVGDPKKKKKEGSGAMTSKRYLWKSDFYRKGKKQTFEEKEETRRKIEEDNKKRAEISAQKEAERKAEFEAKMKAKKEVKALKKKNKRKISFPATSFPKMKNGGKVKKDL